MNLANELLPTLPEGTISFPVSSIFSIRGSLIKKSQVESSSRQEDSNGNIQGTPTRQKLLNDQPELWQQFGMDLLPILVQVSIHCIYLYEAVDLENSLAINLICFCLQIYGSSVNAPVRHKCLSVIGKLMYFSSAETIQSLIETTNISR